MCGQSLKVFIAELHKVYPYGIYMDIGSALDFTCTKKQSRGWSYSYNETSQAFKINNFLPIDWDDIK